MKVTGPNGVTSAGTVLPMVAAAIQSGVAGSTRLGCPIGAGSVAVPYPDAEAFLSAQPTSSGGKEPIHSIDRQ